MTAIDRCVQSPHRPARTGSGPGRRAGQMGRWTVGQGRWAGQMGRCGEQYLYVIKGARSAPRASGARSRAGSATWRRSDGRHARRGGRKRRGHLTPPGWPLPPLHQQVHGGRPPVRDPGHRPSPVGHRHARPTRPRYTGILPRSSLEPTKIPIRALRPAASASLAAQAQTLDCDLPGSVWRQTGGWPGMVGPLTSGAKCLAGPRLPKCSRYRQSCPSPRGVISA
jgi:hypothetical protein